MVEGARLESVYMGNCIKGSNPFPSAAFLELGTAQLNLVNPARFGRKQR